MIAADLMTQNPRTLRVDDSVGEARRALSVMDVRHLPIVNDDGEIVGIVSDRDLWGESLQLPDGMPSASPISSLMTGAVVTVTPETDLVEVIELLLEQRVGAVPVVDADAQVVGVVSYVDVLRSFGRAVAEAAEERAGLSA
ncbi:MAG: HPP family protein [Polyangiales bacterium]